VRTDTQALAFRGRIGLGCNGAWCLSLSVFGQPRETAAALSQTNAISSEASQLVQFSPEIWSIELGPLRRERRAARMRSGQIRSSGWLISSRRFARIASAPRHQAVRDDILSPSHGLAAQRTRAAQRRAIARLGLIGVIEPAIEKLTVNVTLDHAGIDVVIPHP
jgi:hypothetical protein